MKQEYLSQITSALERLQSQAAIRRLWAHDHTLWKPQPDEIVNRLGWLHCTEWMPSRLHQLNAFVKGLRKEGFTQALLLGMGGSSLAPQVFRATFGVQPQGLDLQVLDTTEPRTILSIDQSLDYSKTLFIVSTKSGGTVETFSLFRYFYQRAQQELGAANSGAHFVAITDPGSALEQTAQQLGFRALFLNDPNIGGRYSALSLFGLVPAALLGLDVSLLLEQAAQAVKQCQNEQLLPMSNNPGASLGAAIGAMTLQGRDKLTIFLSPSIASFGAWLEQLIAESSGKEGKGIVPVIEDKPASPDSYADDRFFVYLRLHGEEDLDPPIQALQSAGHPVMILPLTGRYNLAEQFFTWEVATALACHIIGVNPFDQPNVEAAKVLARQFVSTYKQAGQLPQPSPAFENETLAVYTPFNPSTPQEALNRFLSQRPPQAYIALQAYLPYQEGFEAALQDLRMVLQTTTRCAVTLGFGPRFLHSTGQLHKGDGGNGLFIQFTCTPPHPDLPIPDEIGTNVSSMSFGTLILAQALGDHQALVNENRQVIRFHLKQAEPSILRSLIL